ncbi:MAG: Hsp20/alpha crystallin family protein [Phycisphaerales bacterium]|nr:MAG: Hsp20/alpha crystallin family protein [Phycisphaerales bacterium]
MMMIRRVNEPFAGLRFRNEMDRLWSNFFGQQANGCECAGRGYPNLNVWEDGEAYIAEAEVPGIKLEDLEISVVDDELTIKGERKACGCEDVTYHRRERGVGSFSRVLHLPAEVDPEKVEATLSNGVLTIKLAKAQAVLPRKIEVTAG